MSVDHSQAQEDPRPTEPIPLGAQAFLSRALLLDLEVLLTGRISELGAILGTEQCRDSGPAGLKKLAQMSARAQWVIGHNVVAHDLERIRITHPQHPVLGLPAIDTLVLSPLTFPHNPYHRLVKDYKLVKESANNPVEDARLSGVLFADQWEALTRMQTQEGDRFRFLHHLLTEPEGESDRMASGFVRLFEALGSVRPTAAEAKGLSERWLGRHGCAHASIPAEAWTTRDGRHALAYALTWLGVAGGTSVLPTWVRRNHAKTADWIRLWRGVPCTDTQCGWCRVQHDPQVQLKRWFGFEDFRDEPKTAEGGSLQRAIVEAGMRNEPLLAILPTSGGKSLCFQLPALVRHVRTGALTVVVSPLQALMKDQVDGLIRRTGNAGAAALYGLLTQPERSDVLRRIQLGDIAVLYVSPEQFRNRSFRTAVQSREVGAWVFDEAHCLSKWGHDFRPDYLYAGRFIRELSQELKVPVAAVACFTATAKREVQDEIVAYFRKELELEMRVFEGGVSRDNLEFAVEETGEHGKLGQVEELLEEHLKIGKGGSAVVFRSRRNHTEVTAEYLRGQGWSCEFFHAGLTPPEKKRIQDEFIAGRVQVICATNAFGMGIDKDDVRLVIHADTPGSLENYLQEAGRAGRDGRRARCVLLFDEEDCEAQFRLGALSELGRRDIAQILRGLRKSAKGRDEVVITSGEILRDEELDVSIDPAGTMADTQVRTAVAWLERAGFIERNENLTSVFQARLLVKTLEEAQVLMKPLNLPQPESRLWLAILREIMNATPTDVLSVDQLALLPEFAALPAGRPAESVGPAWVSARILKILDSMAQAKLLKRDTLLTAYVRYKVADHSLLRLQRAMRLERALIDLLTGEEMDPSEREWLPLSLRLVNQRLLDAGEDSSPHALRKILGSLSQDGRGFAGQQGSFEIRHVEQDRSLVRIRRGWALIRELSERRHKAAGLVLQRLMAEIPPETDPQADLLVKFTFEQLQAALESDLVLRKESPDLNALVERSLLYLHEQAAIELRQGLAIFRSAMTIRLKPDRNGQKYGVTDFEPLAAHYRERILQVHVMGEYARRGLERMEEAMQLVLAYFKLGREEFVQRYVPLKAAIREHATTATSYERIVTDLENPDQIRIVTAPLRANLLVLAGPGSGKTRVVVHRTAYLLRVYRVRPRSILVCCYNRMAAIELRRRLVGLVGEDARGVTILTYHSLALRLLGRSIGQNASASEPVDFDQLIMEATALLRGERVPAGVEADEIRDRLLAGFEHILVDEYQDIDERQYALIAALAGRTLEDPDQKLSILAVGDDDQSIYQFRGANVEFIRRFKQDYDATLHYLVENYRSSRRIIDAANALIAVNSDRMKGGHPIRIDRHRSTLPAGGDLELSDALTRGRVQLIGVDDALHQAETVLGEIRRKQSIAPGKWSDYAVLSREHRDLALVRAVLEREGIPVRWRADRRGWPRLSMLREIHAFLSAVEARARQRFTGPELETLLEQSRAAAGADNPWVTLLTELISAWKDEVGDGPMPAMELGQFLREALAEMRRDAEVGDGVVLSTVHAAKGTEYDHVLLIGAWSEPRKEEESEEQRRVFYVGMTRARRSLTILDQTAIRPSLPGQMLAPELLRREAAPVEADPGICGRSYEVLGLDSVFISHAGKAPDDAPIHHHLKALRPGDRLTAKRAATGSGTGVALVDLFGNEVARLSAAATRTWEPRIESIAEIRVRALVHRVPETEETLGIRIRATSWEVPVVEMVWNADRH